MYNQQPWSTRVGQLGDIAEGVFAEVSPLGQSIPYGLNRPPFKVKHLTPEQRNTPDFLTGTGIFVEVMGCGRDGIIKLKLEKWDAQRKWDKHMGEVRYFFWNSATSEWALVTMDQMRPIVASEKRRSGVQQFHDGNEYIGLPWDQIPNVFPYAK